MANELKNPIGDILKVPELKKRILFTMGVVAAYRIGATIPVLRDIVGAHRADPLHWLYVSAKASELRRRCATWRRSASPVS